MTQLYFEQMHSASQVFTPGAPINSKDLFAGRASQVNRIVETITQPGRHPIIFGQRGVGKTSLSNIICDSISGALTVRIGCDGADTFSSIWNRVFINTSITFREKGFGLTPAEVTRHASLASFLPESKSEITPSDVAAVLHQIRQWAIIVLDEFDKARDPQLKAYMADLVKSISDMSSKVTLVLVGVGKNIKDLIGEHPSIERNLVQIELPKMNAEEIKSIITKGFGKLNMKVAEAVLDEIPTLADGFPHYAHLLGLSSAKAAFTNGAKFLTSELFHVGCDSAIQDAIEKYRDAFSQGTATTQASRYPRILCACGYAQHDDRGVFKATDVVDAMSLVFKEYLTIQSVVPALGEFASPKRGSILEKVQVGNRSHYRFTDPMMRPFLRVKTQSLLIASQTIPK